MGAVHFSKGTKKENKGYGYSPIDFITDSLLLCEAERVFDQRLDIQEIIDIAKTLNVPAGTVYKWNLPQPTEYREELKQKAREMQALDRLESQLARVKGIYSIIKPSIKAIFFNICKLHYIFYPIAFICI